jgi:hypothetical protein
MFGCGIETELKYSRIPAFWGAPRHVKDNALADQLTCELIIEKEQTDSGPGNA